jgi:hypothetical protein
MLKLWADIRNLVRHLLSQYNQCSTCGQQSCRMSFHVFRQGNQMTILPSEISASYSSEKPQIRAQSDIVCNKTCFYCLPLDQKALWVALIGCDPYGSSPSVNGQDTEVRVLFDRRHRGVEIFELFIFPKIM